MGATSSALGVGDLALAWSSRGFADLVMIDDDLGSDRGLETAVLLSLFTDRRCADDDEPPSGDPADRRGWWADQLLPVEGDKFGSRLWLLDRAVRKSETARLADEYVREAVAWMIEDRVISSVDVTIEITENALLIALVLPRPGRDAVAFQFAHVWEHQS